MDYFYGELKNIRGYDYTGLESKNIKVTVDNDERTILAEFIGEVDPSRSIGKDIVTGLKVDNGKLILDSKTYNESTKKYESNVPAELIVFNPQNPESTDLTQILAGDKVYRIIGGSTDAIRGIKLDGDSIDPDSSKIVDIVLKGKYASVDDIEDLATIKYVDNRKKEVTDALSSHINDEGDKKHVTTSEKETWNRLTDTVGTVANDLEGHKENNIVHITAEERTTWNNKLDKSALTEYRKASEQDDIDETKANKEDVEKELKLKQDKDTLDVDVDTLGYLKKEDLFDYAKKGDVKAEFEGVKNRLTKVEGSVSTLDETIKQHNTDIQELKNTKADREELSGLASEYYVDDRLKDETERAQGVEGQLDTRINSVEEDVSEHTQSITNISTQIVQLRSNKQDKLTAEGRIIIQDNKISVDLNGYATESKVATDIGNAISAEKTERVAAESILNNAIEQIKSDLSKYATTDFVNSELILKQNITDTTLRTENKTIPGAINEVLAKAESRVSSYVISVEDNDKFKTSVDIVEASSITDINGNIIQTSAIPIGTNIYVTESAYPNRWYGDNGKFYKLTSTIDLSNYYTKSEIDARIVPLETGIIAESEARVAADTALGTRIDNEKSARESKDTELETSISGLSTRIGTAESDILELEGRITQAESDIDAVESAISTKAEKEYVDSEIARVEGLIPEVDVNKAYVDQEINKEKEARELEDAKLKSDVDDLKDKIEDKADKSYVDEHDAELQAAVNARVKKIEEGTNGTARVFNEKDGGGAKFENNDGVESFVGVNDGSLYGLRAQIYADRKEGDKYIGTRINVFDDKITYQNKNKYPDSNIYDDDLEVAVHADLEGFVDKSITDDINQRLEEAIADIAKKQDKLTVGDGIKIETVDNKTVISANFIPITDTEIDDMFRIA